MAVHYWADQLGVFAANTSAIKGKLDAPLRITTAHSPARKRAIHAACLWVRPGFGNASHAPVQFCTPALFLVGPRYLRGLGYGICLNPRLCCPSLRVRPSLAFIRSMFYARFPNPFRVAEEKSCRVSGSRLTAPFKPPGLNGAQLQAPTTVFFRAVSVPKPARPLGPLLLIRQPCGRMQTHRWHLLHSLRYVGAHSCCPLRSRTPSKPRRPH